jgi:hypothetical protein
MQAVSSRVSGAASPISMPRVRATADINSKATSELTAKMAARIARAAKRGRRAMRRPTRCMNPVAVAQIVMPVTQDSAIAIRRCSALASTDIMRPIPADSARAIPARIRWVTASERFTAGSAVILPCYTANSAGGSGLVPLGVCDQSL